MNKERARLVPAAAVKPALRVVGTFIGPKACVAGPVSPWLNPTAQLSGPLGVLRVLEAGEVSGTSWVGVKSCHPWGTTDGEGSSLERARR